MTVWLLQNFPSLVTYSHVLKIKILAMQSNIVFIRRNTMLTAVREFLFARFLNNNNIQVSTKIMFTRTTGHGEQKS